MYKDKRVEKKKTVTMKRNLNPIFNESFAFDVPTEKLRETTIVITVMDKDRLSRNDVIGKVGARQAGVCPHKTQEGRWASTGPGPGRKGATSGPSLPLRASEDEEVGRVVLRLGRQETSWKGRGGRLARDPKMTFRERTSEQCPPGSHLWRASRVGHVYLPCVSRGQAPGLSGFTALPGEKWSDCPGPCSTPGWCEGA